MASRGALDTLNIVTTIILPADTNDLIEVFAGAGGGSRVNLILLTTDNDAEMVVQLKFAKGGGGSDCFLAAHKLQDGAGTNGVDDAVLLARKITPFLMTGGDLPDKLYIRTNTTLTAGKSLYVTIWADDYET